MCVLVHVSRTRGLMPLDRFHVLLSECTSYTLMSDTSREIGPVHVRMPKMVKISHREEKTQYVIILLSVAYQCSYASISSNVWWPLTPPAYRMRMLWQQKNASLPLSSSLSIFRLSLFFPMHHSHLDHRCACIIP